LTKQSSLDKTTSDCISTDIMSPIQAGFHVIFHDVMDFAIL